MTLAIQQQVSLTAFNTLALASVAEHFVAVRNVNELQEALELAEQQRWPVTILGGGSNVVCAEQLPGLVIKIELSGVELLEQIEDTVTVRVGAGENWHQLVLETLNRNWFGLENLSLIPGTVGAAPVQNIGAYGVELADRLVSVEYIDLATKRLNKLTAEQCKFGYRDSIFKGELRGKAVITAVTLKLSIRPQLVLEYPSLQQQLSHLAADEITPQQVSEVVCHIRSSKLPDPDVIPNAGSFFKNPIVPSAEAQRIRTQYPELVVFPAEPGYLKLAAGWLIEQAGWKGCAQGPVGVHDKQALVLVNRGQGNSVQLLALADDIVQSVADKFGVTLEMEPRILPERVPQ